MPEFLLSALPRGRVGSGTLSARRLLRSGYVPAVLYGHGVTNLILAVEAKALGKMLPRLSSSTLLSLSVGEGDVRRVLVQDVQQHPLTGEPVHVDFHQVQLTEKIKAKVPLRAVGVSPAVKDHGGVFVQSVNEIEVEALPQDLPSEIPVDLAKLATFQDRITVVDLTVPGNVEVHAKPEEVVAVVMPPRTEEELKAELGARAEAAPAAEVKTEAEVKKATEEAEKVKAGEPLAEKPTSPSPSGKAGLRGPGKPEEKKPKLTASS